MRTRNRLLDSLGRAERAAVLADCEPVELQFAAVLCEPGDRIRDAYFPLSGSIALIALADRRAALEVGSIGNEGMFGFPLALGRQRQPLRAIVESQGEALRIDAARLREHLAKLPGLQRELQRQLSDLLSQLARAASSPASAPCARRSPKSMSRLPGATSRARAAFDATRVS